MQGKCIRDTKKIYAKGLCAACYAKEYRNKNAEHLKEYNRTYNSEWLKNGKRKLKSNRIYRENLRKEIFKKYGEICARCGFNDIRALQIDHINGGGNQERANMSPWKFYKLVLLDMSNKFQILCANCNVIKKKENNEYRRGGEFR